MTADEVDPNLSARLRALGSQDVDAALDAEVRARMAATEPEPDVAVAFARRGSARPKRRIAALAATAILATGGAAAATDSLPAPVQRTAHRVFDRVGVEVPDRPGTTPPPPTDAPGPSTTAPTATTAGTSTTTTTTTPATSTTTSASSPTTTAPAPTSTTTADRTTTTSDGTSSSTTRPPGEED